MTTVIKIRNFYVEVSDLMPLEVDRLADVKETIAGMCSYVQGAFEGGNAPDELKARFGIRLAGDTGVPFITKGGNEGTIQVEATWKKDAGDLAKATRR